MLSHDTHTALHKASYDALALLLTADLAFISANVFLPPILSITTILNGLILATIACVFLIGYLQQKCRTH